MTPQLSPVSQAAAHTLDAQPQSDLERLLQRPFTPREIFEDATFEKVARMAKILSESSLSIPKELKNNVGDCMAVVIQAMLWGINAFAAAQCCHVINGKLGYEAKLINAVVMNSGAIVGGFKYEYEGAGQALRCRVGAVLRGETEITWNEWYGVADAVVKNSPLWKSNPAMQLGYVQVKFWVRAYAPGALLGIYTADELMDAEPELVPTPTPRGPQRRSESAAAAAPSPAAAPAQGLAEDSPPPPAASPAAAPAAAPAPAPATTAGAELRGCISVGQVAYLRNKMNAAGAAESQFCARYEVGSIEEFTLEMFDEVKSELLALT